MLGAGWERKRKLVPGPECDSPTKPGKGRAPPTPRFFFLCPGGELKPWEEMPPLPTAPGAAPKFTRCPPQVSHHGRKPSLEGALGQAPLAFRRCWHLLKLTTINMYGTPIKCRARVKQLTNITLPSVLQGGSHHPCSSQVGPELRELTQIMSESWAAGPPSPPLSSVHVLASSLIAPCSQHWFIFLFPAPKHGHFPRFSVSPLEKLIFSKS